VHVKIAVSSYQARAATAVKQTQSLKETRNAPIFATGFHWMRNIARKAQGSQKIGKKPAMQKPPLTIYSTDNMDNRPVLFLDSGIGGIPYCRDFMARNRRESVCYLADRENFPYGERSKEDLIAILTALTEKVIKTINPKIAVLACNTATVSALASLRQNFPRLSFVGTVPAIKPAAENGKKIGVLGTARTIDDPYNQNLAGGDCEIFGIAAAELVEFVENRFEEADENEKKEIVRKYVSRFSAGGTDAIVLGCTHFLYLAEDFRREAAPSIKIFDSLDGITKRIESLLDEDGGALRAERDSEPENFFLLTGKQPPDSVWRKRALGFDLRLLHEKSI
jgi:glutamate racemase